MRQKNPGTLPPVVALQKKRSTGRLVELILAFSGKKRAECTTLIISGKHKVGGLYLSLTGRIKTRF
jgi:hypothetical protein